jgi:transposase-like protein
VVYGADREVEKGGHRVILEETPGRVISNKEKTMAATASIDAIEWLRKQIEETAPDPMKAMLTTMVGVLMSAEVDAVCGADYGERADERVNSRNGYRTRPWDTRVGSIDLQVPKLRHGTYFPGWLLEPRRRAEKALTAVVAEAYALGVSTRKVEDLVQALGIEKLSKSQVSQLAKGLDAGVKSFRERPLDEHFKYLWLDALVMKCREGGRIVSVACLVAVGVNGDGRREILGLDVVTGEDGAGWLAFLRGLRARGLKGVERNRPAPDAWRG